MSSLRYLFSGKAGNVLPIQNKAVSGGATVCFKNVLAHIKCTVFSFAGYGLPNQLAIRYNYVRRDSNPRKGWIKSPQRGFEPHRPWVLGTLSIAKRKVLQAYTLENPRAPKWLQTLSEATLQPYSTNLNLFFHGKKVANLTKIKLTTLCFEYFFVFLGGL